MLKPLDLTFGNPSFLQELWQEHSIGGFISQANSGYDSTTVSADLADAIYALHEATGNVKNPREYSIVIGNGASQLLTAVSRSLKLGVYAPFWSRFNYLVEDMQLFTKEWPHYDAGHNLLVTYPNNPDGRLSPIVLEAQVVDASYHWPHYYPKDYKLRKLDNDILLFSFSKLSGLSSARIGWALVKNKELESSIRQHVELMTCGVNPASQQVAAEAIDSILLDNQTFITAARNILQDRWNFINNSLCKDMPHSGVGMFLFIQDSIQKLKSLGIEGFSGDQFGGSKDWIRLNLGISNRDFEEFKIRLLELV